MHIEPLELRIAPAAVFKFTDVDGDAVTITTSKGTNADLAAIVTVLIGAGTEIQRIDFSLNAAVFAGTNLTVTAKRSPAGGDGLANVGFIDASATGGGTALDLGSITIRGDLGQIDAGDTSTGTPAVKSLTVQSMGEFGVATQQFGGSLESNLNGALGSLKKRATCGSRFSLSRAGPMEKSVPSPSAVRSSAVPPATEGESLPPGRSEP